jgi:hypothetical protein
MLSKDARASQLRVVRSCDIDDVRHPVVAAGTGQRVSRPGSAKQPRERTNSGERNDRTTPRASALLF